MERRKAEDERLQAEEREREAKKPRHQDLELDTLLGIEDAEDKDEQKNLWRLKDTMVNVWPKPQPAGTYDSFAYDDTEEEEREVVELRRKLKKLKIVARAKVTMNRIYSAQYHPEKSKDLIFFGGNGSRSDFSPPIHQSVAQINMGNWGFGTLEHPWTRSETTRRLTRKSRKVESIGDYKCTGLPPPGRQFHASALTLQIPIA